MQCHRCPKSVTNGGVPDEECLTCKAAEYLDNDHETVSPTDDVGKAMRHAKNQQSDNSLESHLGDHSAKTTRTIDDCLNVIGVLKTCHHESLPHIAKIVSVLMAAGAGFGMAISMLNGDTISEYARSSGTSRQAAQQKWSRIVERAPMLSGVPNSRGLNPNRRRKRNAPKENGGGNGDVNGKTAAIPAQYPSTKRRKPKKSLRRRIRMA